jgi:hypothetical protein
MNYWFYYIIAYVQLVIFSRWNRLYKIDFDVFAEEGGLMKLDTKALWFLYESIKKANNVPVTDEEMELKKIILNK